MENFKIFYCVACLVGLYIVAWCLWWRNSVSGIPKMKYLPPLPAPLQPEYVNFNLNCEIKVKLTERGYEFMAQDFNETLGEILKETRMPLYYKMRADADGYMRFQVWEFMRLFGPDLKVVDDYWDCDILMKAKDLQVRELPKVN